MTFIQPQRVINIKTRKYSLKPFMRTNKKKLELIKLKRSKMIEEIKIKLKEQRKHKIKQLQNDIYILVQ